MKRKRGQKIARRPRASHRQRRLLIEQLENRRVLATFAESEPNDNFSQANDVGAVTTDPVDITGVMTLGRCTGACSPIGEKLRIPNADYFGFTVGANHDFRISVTLTRLAHNPSLSLFDSGEQLIKSEAITSLAGVSFTQNLAPGIHYVSFDAEQNFSNSDVEPAYTIRVEQVDTDKPAVDKHSGIVVGGASLTLSCDHLSATDPDSNLSSLTFTLKSEPAKGQLKKNGTVLATAGTFTQQDITDGKIVYTHAGGTDLEDTFTFTVRDDGGMKRL